MKFDYLIIDIESYLYKACSACKKLEPHTREGCFIEVYDVMEGMAYLERTIESFADKFSCSNVLLIIGGDNNFRKEINPQYKSHRKPKPLMYDGLLEYLTTKYQVICIPTLEADDTCRIIYEDNDTFAGDKLIISIDKDFYSVPCVFYRDNPNNNEVVTVTEDDARINELVQVIMGDKTDGYQGIPLYGEKKARAFVNKDTTLGDVIELYKENKLSEDVAIMNYNMAHIVSYEEYKEMRGK